MLAPIRRPVASLVLVVVAALAPVAAPASAAQAQGSWLDEPVPPSWNAVGMAVPAAPTGGYANPSCGRDERPAETNEDLAVAAGGWRLFREYRAGWGITVVTALSGYDGMCRPTGFQVFAFFGGQLAGTLSPAPMNSREDGSLSEWGFLSPEPGENTLGATFVRYAPTDPLCCPSGQTSVTYTLERGPTGPVLVPVGAETSWR